MWVSDTMTTWQSFVTFMLGFSIVFICLVSLAVFIIISSKIINAIVKEGDKPKVNTSGTSVNAVKKTVVKDNESEVEELAVIISAVSEEMKLPIDRFEVVSIKQI